MKLRIEKTNKNLSFLGGAPMIEELLKSVNFNSRYNAVLPTLKYKGFQDSFYKFKAMVCSFISECDCLDDIDELNQDPAYLEMIDHKAYTPKTYGNFLRSFNEKNIYDMQNATIDLNLRLRSKLEPDFIRQGKIGENLMILDCDSTKNRQYAQKMEGVEINHEKNLSLDTQNIFDELGFQYHIDVRAGATHSSNGAGLAAANVIRQIKANKKYGDKKFWMRADSGYYGHKFFNALLAVGCDFIVAVNKGGKSFPKILGQIHNWSTTDLEDSDRIKFYDGRECEIGSTNYRIKDCERRLRYVVMRAKKPSKGTLFEDHTEYDYFAFCTSLDELRLDDIELIRTYRKRGQAENYIKEMKYAFDLKHYPCLKLSANNAYAAIACVAYNLMRFIGLMEVDGYTNGKPKLSKKIRKQLLFIPCLVARTGRDRRIVTTKLYYERICAYVAKLKKISIGSLDCYV